jgi:hypothetical protein
VIGFSPTAAAVLVVILVRCEDEPGLWCGANGWRPNSADRRIYAEGTQRHEGPKQARAARHPADASRLIRSCRIEDVALAHAYVLISMHIRYRVISSELVGQALAQS